MAYDDNNIFARILRGEAPCVPVFEDAFTLAFMDVMPQADGHVLVIPKEPAATLFDLSPEGAAASIRSTRRAAIAVRDAFAAPGVFVGQFNGAAAGQTVPHCHFHVIPRFPDAKPRAHASVMEDSAKLRAFAERIIAALPPA
ncbi:HIT domain-containing protein [Azoarcus indigens]|uniref:Histidine triad (HIT) family protein n=1 Tax=Azoarcus indigens TaxID=29545 RepID=A0A4R6E2A4_9RHOO|nr:HIT family protein [Azoarcus indigens]NMG64697.1 HIT domain-containing protein [Azoarcus indigens]TDN50918.1 histidine triad (HIT) family protein [Azoarcus indigens]